MTLKREITSGAQFLDAVNTKYGTSLNADATPSMLLSAFKVGSETASYNKTDDSVVEDINEDTPTEYVKLTVNIGEGRFDSETPTYIEVEKGSTVTLELLESTWGPDNVFAPSHSTIDGYSLIEDSNTLILESFVVTADTTIYVHYSSSLKYWDGEHPDTVSKLYCLDSVTFHNDDPTFAAFIETLKEYGGDTGSAFSIGEHFIGFTVQYDENSASLVRISFETGTLQTAFWTGYYDENEESTTLILSQMSTTNAFEYDNISYNFPGGSIDNIGDIILKLVKIDA